MVSLTSLWLPILLSAVAVFIVSSIVHMVLRYHNTDFRKLPAEDDILRALGAHAIPTGEYIFPYPDRGGASMKDPAFIEKRTKGPAGILNAFPSEMPNMGALLAKWFLYSIVVSLFAGYLASRALPVGADSGEVFRFTATIGFIAYGLGHISDSIWWGRAWTVTLKNLLDALLYGGAMGAVFVWMWP
jgi:hypothetical protein